MPSMSMPWMRMPGETWLGATLSFLGMWLLMMAAMMLPSLAPSLVRHARAAPMGGKCRAAAGTVLFGAGYFAVWAAMGLIIFPCGVGIAWIVVHRPTLERALPTVISLVVLLAGALQFTEWKAHQLECSREWPWPDHPLRSTLTTSWKHGVKLGLHCSYCCLGMTAVLLATGFMELRSMALITAAITAERIAPSPRLAARLIGAALVITALFLIARANGVWGQ